MVHRYRAHGASVFFHLNFMHDQLTLIDSKLFMDHVSLTIEHGLSQKLEYALRDAIDFKVRNEPKELEGLLAGDPSVRDALKKREVALLQARAKLKEFGMQN